MCQAALQQILKILRVQIKCTKKKTSQIFGIGLLREKEHTQTKLTDA